MFIPLEARERALALPVHLSSFKALDVHGKFLVRGFVAIMILYTEIFSSYTNF